MISLETNKQRIIRELIELKYDIGMAAEKAVEQYTHKPDSKLSFDDTETISYYNSGEVNMSLTGLDILSREAVEENLRLVATEIRDNVHNCLKEVLK